MTKRLTIALVALAMFVLVAVMPVSADAQGTWYQVSQNINQGATVFIGEQGLNIAPALASANTAALTTGVYTIGWWGPGADILATSPTNSFDLQTRLNPFTVSQSDFDGYDGQWYLVNPANQHAIGPAVLSVKSPTLAVSIRDPAQSGADVSGKSVTKGSALNFQVDTNMYPALYANQRYPVWNKTGKGVGSDGYIDILVKTESGTTLQQLYDNYGVQQTLIALNVTTAPYKWKNVSGSDGVWQTDALVPSTNEGAYAAGTYVVSAQSKLNNIKDNYLSGSAAYTGRTVSETKTITLVSDTVSITANKDSVVRTKPFSVTITGKPSKFYNVWVKNTKTMALATYDGAPPVITKFQEKVFDGNQSAFNYAFQNSGSLTVGDVAFGSGPAGNSPATDTFVYSYALVQLSPSGTRTVEFGTTSNTKAQKYTVRVEQNFGATDFKSDEVDVKVEKGAVTIVASGDQNYFLGEEIKLSGTNTESTITHLFIIGPNLDEKGGILTNPTQAVNITAWDSVKADVLGDNTWSYKWGTSQIDLDAGTYTIYAVSKPYNKDNKLLGNAAYGTVSIIIKKPFISATASQSTVAKGDRIFITGKAEGQPQSVMIWVLGKNYAIHPTETVNSDSTFKFEFKQDLTRTLASGQYYVVVQHPMQNNQFDIDTSSTNPELVVNKMLGSNSTTGAINPTVIFRLSGPGSLQGTDAAQALVTGINDPNVDDTYTKFPFSIEEPFIFVDQPADKRMGDKFSITAKTNLAVDDEVLVQVYSSSFKPTLKSESGEFSGATGTIKVTKGDSGLNKLSFDVDSSTFKTDEYIVTMEAVIQEATGTALFNVIEGALPTTVPTNVPTTVAPTAVPTAVPTTIPPTKAPAQPGFGALVALIGLGAVAFIVVRRH